MLLLNCSCYLRGCACTEELNRYSHLLFIRSCATKRARL